ncbi:MAG: hypothetical protein ACXW2E_01570 [Nitrososphaeraceae archaeon]
MKRFQVNDAVYLKDTASSIQVISNTNCNITMVDIANAVTYQTGVIEGIISGLILCRWKVFSDSYVWIMVKDSDVLNYPMPYLL